MLYFFGKTNTNPKLGTFIIDTPSRSRKLQALSTPALQLLAASFIVLFLELTLIRWIAVQIRAVAYFPNLILISAFLGLGSAACWPTPGRCAGCGRQRS